jgi:hypothetical protein
VRDRPPAIIRLLTELASGVKGSRALDARALLLHIDAPFVAMLTLMTDLLGRTHTVSKMLQSPILDIGKAGELISAVQQQLKEARSEIDGTHFEDIWSHAQNTCQLCDIEAACNQSTDLATSGLSADRVNSEEGPCRSRRIRRLPSRFANSIVMETVGDRPAVDNKNDFKVHVYNNVMDSMITELDVRFSDSHCLVMKGIQCLNPIDENFAKISCIQAFAESHGADTDDLGHDLHQAKRLLERSAKDANFIKPTTVLSFLSFLTPFKAAFHELHQLCKIAVSLPVSTASCERSFSALRQIKTYVRNSMIESRLSAVAVIAIEKERAHLLNVDDILDVFARRHGNRRICLY